MQESANARMKKFCRAVKEQTYGKAPRVSGLEPIHHEIDNYTKVVGSVVLVDVSELHKPEIKWLLNVVNKLGYNADWTKENYRW